MRKASLEFVNIYSTITYIQINIYSKEHIFKFNIYSKEHIFNYIKTLYNILNNVLNIEKMPVFYNFENFQDQIKKNLT